ncbi:hypothetical protein QUF75_16350 [Desulfococcaceae bacterium HSG7]|nr:hypothetical protein [Desulfococcaceae bacterium HSG7]
MKNQPEKHQIICQKLLRGYQFSESDLYLAENESLYNNLHNNFQWFKDQLAVIGVSLIQDDGVIFLEKEDKILSGEEKQTVVVLFLLTDMWMEKDGTFGDLFQLRIHIADLDWFRDGYGKDYLIQVGIEEITHIEDLFRKIYRKGLVYYYSESQTITLRKPAERIINMARKIHSQIKAKESDADE